MNEINEVAPLSREVLIAQGSCCWCKNCPYAPKHVKGAIVFVDEKESI